MGWFLHLLKHVVFVVIKLFFQVTELDSQGLFLLLELPSLLTSWFESCFQLYRLRLFLSEFQNLICSFVPDSSQLFLPVIYFLSQYDQFFSILVFEHKELFVVVSEWVVFKFKFIDFDFVLSYFLFNIPIFIFNSLHQFSKMIFDSFGFGIEFFSCSWSDSSQSLFKLPASVFNISVFLFKGAQLKFDIKELFLSHFQLNWVFYLETFQFIGFSLDTPV